MKRLITLLAFSFFSLSLFTCSSEEETENNTPNNPNNSGPVDVTVEKIKIEGIDGLDLDNLSVQTFDEISEVDSNGNLLNPVEDTEGDDLPMLLLKDEEIILGYYSRTGQAKSIAIDDILLFSFTLNPILGWLNLSQTELMNEITQSSNYNLLSSKVSNALQSNLSPFDDDSFNELLIESSMAIYLERYNNRNSSSQLNDTFYYQFNHSRNGQVSWDNQFPAFAKVGIEITDASGVVGGPYILDKKEIILTASSAVDWLKNYFGGTTSSQTTKQLPSNGNYTITFSNGADGIGTTALEEQVDLENRIDLAVQTVQLAIPIGVKKLPSSCKINMLNLYKNLALEPIKLAMLDESFDLLSFINNLQNDTFEVLSTCTPAVNLSYWAILRELIEKLEILAPAQDVSNLIFFFRDYIASDINGSELRYFYDGYSYGGLVHSNVSGGPNVAQTEFVGPHQSQHSYSGLVVEDIFKYEIERGAITSTVQQLTEPALADGIPFAANITGDAQLNENSTILTQTMSNNTNLNINFLMGENNSQVEIRPDIQNGQGIGEPATINLLNSACDNSLVITNITNECEWNGNPRWEYFVDFENTGSGTFTPQIELEFQSSTGAWEESDIYGSLISGDANQGRFRLLITASPWSWRCSPGNGYSCPANWYDAWRVRLKIPNCNYETEWSEFQITYYTLGCD